MADEPHEFEVLQPIADPVNAGHTAYQPGQGIHAAVVEAWDLQIGEQVRSLQEPQQIERPAGNANRETWLRYRLAQGHDGDKVGDLGRDDLRDLPDPKPRAGEQPAEPDTEKTDAEPDTDDGAAKPRKSTRSTKAEA